jgi:hypothetical protein
MNTRIETTAHCIALAAFAVCAMAAVAKAIKLMIAISFFIV